MEKPGRLTFFLFDGYSHAENQNVTIKSAKISSNGSICGTNCDF
jgi:hypothetical protein